MGIIQERLKKRKTHDRAFRVVDRGPNWLFIRMSSDSLKRSLLSDQSLADRLWRLTQRHLVYRLVLEMDDVAVIDEVGAEELRRLHDLLVEHDGALRLCGLDRELVDPLIEATDCSALCNHATRHDAVVGDSVLRKPR